jgi:hypothetical protein
VCANGTYVTDAIASSHTCSNSGTAIRSAAATRGWYDAIQRDGPDDGLPLASMHSGVQAGSPGLQIVGSTGLQAVLRCTSSRPTPSPSSGPIAIRPIRNPVLAVASAASSVRSSVEASAA